MTRGVPEKPDGLTYRPQLIAGHEERPLLDLVEAMDFRAVVMRGQVARRTVRHFGWEYDYERWSLVPGEPLPGPLSWLRDRCAVAAGIQPAERLDQALVTRYPPGAGIGWHRDAPMFGPQVVGVSLLSSCRMRFQRKAAGVRCTWQLELEPRSAYVLAGAARSSWQHSIPATEALRYSITFRSVRNPTRWKSAEAHGARSP